MTRSVRVAFAVAGLGLGLGLTSHGQTASEAAAASAAPVAVDPMWKESFDAFAAADKARPPHSGGVLFVGSSTIRLWADLESQFATGGPGAMPPRQPGADAAVVTSSAASAPEPYIIKRGFGGSKLEDVAKYVPQLVLPYEPSLVIVYAGDNDIAEGRTPEQVLQSYQSVVKQIHHALPGTRIAFISIKPSPSRLPLMATTLRANQLIAAWSKADASLDYIDIYDKMLGTDGLPRADLFQPDMLHLNATGYAIWQAAIRTHLTQTQVPAPLAAVH